MRIIAIGAHPDDVEIGAGGTLAKHQANGDDISIIVLTSGETGRLHYPVHIREMEASAAAALLDADITLAQLPDSELPDGKPTIDVIENAACVPGYDIAYIHSLHDTHQDHRAAAHASRVALRSVPKIYAFQSPSATAEFTPVRYTDITKFMPHKLELIRAHKSQDIRQYMQDGYIQATAQFYGLKAGCCHSEPFEVVMDRDSHPGHF
jgi:LmbE family N-acetylglucosaminyl deacetylase